MYSRGMLGSWRENMVLRPTSLVRARCGAVQIPWRRHRCAPCHVLGLSVVDNVSKLNVPLVLELLQVLLTLAVGAWCEAKLSEGGGCCVLAWYIGPVGITLGRLRVK